jgi:hypothetical protein
MLATAIAAPKISFDTFAMTAFSAMLSTHRRLDYLPQIPSHFGLSPPRNSVMRLHRARRIAANLARLPELTAARVFFSRVYFLICGVVQMPKLRHG